MKKRRRRSPDWQKASAGPWMLLIALGQTGPLVVPSAASAAGKFLTGNDLYESCNGDSRAGSYCAGYITGTVDVWLADDRLCLPGGASNKQAVDLVIAYLERHPERRHYTAESLGFDALNQHFGCQP
jgi:hypothetical protein